MTYESDEHQEKAMTEVPVFEDMSYNGRKHLAYRDGAYEVRVSSGPQKHGPDDVVWAVNGPGLGGEYWCLMSCYAATVDEAKAEGLRWLAEYKAGLPT